MATPSEVRFVGPLVEHREALRQVLARQGYAVLSANNVLRVAAHLSRWLQESGLSLRELTREHLDAFFAARRRAGYTQFHTPRALRPLIRYLESAANCSLAPKPEQAGAGSELLHRYARYLREERSVAITTSNAYSAIAREFLEERFAEGPFELAELHAEDVTSFVLASTRRHSTGGTNYRVTALRSFLRYLYLEGDLRADLAGAIPRVASWRLVGVPKGLTEAQLRRLLRSCDRRRRIGRRDHAVLLLLARLGLRAGEVAGLQLDDVDWKGAELVVRGKGRREARLPLPADVGEVLSGYLRFARPRTSARHVFVRVRAPHTGMASNAVTALVQRHSLLAGLDAVGAHRLRHTAATAMLRAGSSLDEVAQVLRHRSVDTTAIYAKVDWVALRALAQPWPGGVA
ncbi:MAG TPA: tyrosine-type recombinase/integrase [Steroidobacteraceae bacterium]|nr:tyrosine-type recombinase/integrase [Steroidobacteraceae bacterium]